MKNLWDQRYSAEEYAYGTEPNEFLRETLDQLNLTGKMLFPAEGEGRNAIYAAKNGLEVYAFDLSEYGKTKALQLAKKAGVTLHYEVGDFFQLNYTAEQFDAAALIWAHFPPEIRSSYHQRIANLLKPGGLVILEGFSKNNLELRAKNPQIGGPPDLGRLFSTDEVKQEFPNFEIIQLEEKEVELREGKYHNGIGRVIRFIGEKYST